MPSNFCSIDYLAFAGMSVILGLIVQFTKNLIKRCFYDVVVRYYTFAWALILVFIMYYYKGLLGVTGWEIVLTALIGLTNAIIVTLAAIGGYEMLSDPRAQKQKLR